MNTLYEDGAIIVIVFGLEVLTPGTHWHISSSSNLNWPMCRSQLPALSCARRFRQFDGPLAPPGRRERMPYMTLFRVSGYRPATANTDPAVTNRSARQVFPRNWLPKASA